MDGEPIGKGRPRFRLNGAPYTPDKTARYEERLAWTAQAVMAGRPLLEGALEVKVYAFLSIPSSKPKKWKEQALLGSIKPTKKPDADNIAKMLDALNKVVWIDDSQIIRLEVTKAYSDKPRLDIFINEWVDKLSFQF